MSFKEWLKTQEATDPRLAAVRNSKPAKGQYRSGEFIGKPPAVAIGYMKKK